MKESWKPGTLIYPLPAVLVSCGATPEEYNLLTVAWTGTVCTNPPMCYISVRPERHSYEIIRRTGEFVINLTTRDLARAADWCGVRSGRDYDKFREMGLTPGKALQVAAPIVEEAPVSIECRVRQVMPLGSHDMFLAEVVAVQVDADYIDPATAGRCARSRAGRWALPPQSPHLPQGISRLRKFPKQPGQTPGTGSPPQNVFLRENPWHLPPAAPAANPTRRSRGADAGRGAVRPLRAQEIAPVTGICGRGDAV